MNDFEEVLERLGLNEKEAKIYLLLLQVGTSPASALAQRAGIVRSTAQYICKQLVKKGIVSMTEKNNVFLFSAEAPERLMFLIEKKKNELMKDANQLQSILPQLQGMRNPHSVLPKVRLYEGQQGMIDLYESILDMRSPIDSFEESGKVFDMFPDYAVEYSKKREERKIPNRCIAPKGSLTNVSDPARSLEVRHLDPKKYPFTWHIKMCKDLVGIFSFEKEGTVGIGIQHPDIAKNFHLLFEYVWNSLED